jgi:hypothetical protein
MRMHDDDDGNQITGANSRPVLRFRAAPISSHRFIPLWLS